MAMKRKETAVADFGKDLERLGWSRKRLAQELGLSTETLRVYAKDGPPRCVHIAVAAMARGFRFDLRDSV
jgi:lambda repressor-like predicted transcriptional regulator